jgi:hypothetical protein
MALDRLSRGEAIAAASAVVLFAAMFLPWFDGDSSVAGYTGEVPGGGSAWETLELIPVFLMLAIVVGFGNGFARAIDADLGVKISPNAVVAVCGGLAFLLILYRIVDPPGLDAFGGVPVETSLRLGVFLGLLAAAGIGYGGYSAMREEGLTFGDVGDRLSE